MAQKKKNKSVPSNRRRNLLANTKAKVNTKKANLSSQITENFIQISNGGEEATQKFNLKKKKKSIVNTKKANLSNQIIISNTENVTNQISNGEEEEATQKFKLSRCQHKKKNESCKGKSIVKFDQMEIDQAEANVRESCVLLWRSTKQPWCWTPTILHLGLCKVLVKLGKGKDAISSCSEALELVGDLIDALVQRGESKLLTEDWEGAIADLNKAAEKSPQDRNIRKVLKRAERSLKLIQRKVCTRYWECQRHHLYQRL